MSFQDILIFVMIVIIKCYTKQCFNCWTDLCYTWTLSDNEISVGCNSITDTTRHIVMKGPIDSIMYSHSNIRMIESGHSIALYDCTNIHTFIHFQKDTFTPVVPIGTQNFSWPEKDDNVALDKTFQKCLEHYCTVFHRGFLHCDDNKIKYLNLKLTQVLSIRCLRSITYASIISNNLVDITNSMFLKTAVHLIKLVIKSYRLTRIIKCDLFQSIRGLMILDIPYLHNTYTSCIFKHNPKLVLISNATARFWNMCNGTLDFVNDLDNNSAVATTTDHTDAGNENVTTSASEYRLILIFIIIVLMLLVFGAFISVLKYKRKKRSRRPDSDLESCSYVAYDANIDDCID